ncbi:ABC transporter permease subunit [Sphingobacterium sp. SRCM116780]|uniref:ABC transporter permease/substrate-binding protein n=1 Tax=Sphingobacterium sp. SRCM116780 TaxID=2907623 RepID=UPI001F26A6CD|nr:glycine betaine ABC transporter substrate-binding protein [Sphingobacterium sp. SRCM116780]UIR57287.1 ABC transporter permease subunit [Sphingobacterium sp. SRCM116780]
MIQQNLWQFITEQHEKLLNQIVQHLGLTCLSLLLAIAIGVPLGTLIVKKNILANPILAVAGILQTVPSIALLGFMIPVFGIGPTPAIVALLIYALLPIIRNTYTGIIGVDPIVTETAKALGMNGKQLLFKVELPLALPVIIAGIRTAAVINVGVATLASFVAAGGLGEFIFGGISLNNINMILAGAIPAALLAILLDQLIALVQKSRFQRLHKLRYIIPIIFLSIVAVYIWSTDASNKLKAGFTPEFMGRQDGDIGLRSVYGLNMNPTVVNDAIMYKAAYEGELDVISGYSTDGRIKAFNLYVLEDDKKIFPPYYAVPIIKTKTLQQFPKLKQTLNLLAGKINDSIMTELNYRTDHLHHTPEKVAKDFLIQTGLYQNKRNGSANTVRIGSKIFGEQYILVQIYKMLIEGYTDYQVDTKTGLGGTKICFDALMNDAIDFYPEYTGTGLLVLLKPTNQTMKDVTKSPEKTYQYVDAAFRKQYGIEWLKPLGFNNAYALMMRKEQAETLHIKSITDLKEYLEAN